MIQCKCGFSYGENTKKCAICGNSFDHLYPQAPKPTSHRITVSVNGKVVLGFSSPIEPKSTAELIEALQEVKAFEASPVVEDRDLY